MKKISLIFAFLPSIILCIFAGFLMINGHDQCLWFLLVAFLMYPSDFEITEEEDDDVQPK